MEIELYRCQCDTLWNIIPKITCSHNVNHMPCEYSVVEFCEQKLLIRDKNKQFSVIRSDPWLFALYRVQLF